MMNSLYGATANRYFLYYIAEMAEAITTSGQLSIRYSQKSINAYMNSVLKTNNIDYVSYIDTDSVVGSTVLSVNDEKVTIQDLYEKAEDTFIKYDEFNEDYVKDTSGSNLFTYSVDEGGNLNRNKIKYVMKHKVKKKMYKISLPSGENVICTEDHSIIVKNKQNGKIHSIKPQDLNSKNHYIINIDTDSNVLRNKCNAKEIDK